MNVFLVIERYSLFIGFFSFDLFVGSKSCGFDARLLIFFTFVIVIFNFKKEYFKIGLASLCVTVLIIIHSFASVFDLSFNNRSVTASIGLLIIIFLLLAKFD